MGRVHENASNCIKTHHFAAVYNRLNTAPCGAMNEIDACTESTSSAMPRRRGGNCAAGFREHSRQYTSPFGPARRLLTFSGQSGAGFLRLCANIHVAYIIDTHAMPAKIVPLSPYCLISSDDY